MIVLFWLVTQLIILILFLLISNSLAINFINCWLALPFSGICVNFIFITQLSIIQTNFVIEEFGIILIFKINDFEDLSKISTKFIKRLLNFRNYIIIIKNIFKNLIFILKMKIWLDLRFIKDNLYSTFILNLIEWILLLDNKNSYKIYLNPNSWKEKEFKKLKTIANINIIEVGINNFSIKEQIHFLKILRKDKNDLMIFFNHFKPIFYTWEYYIFVSSFKNIYYWNFNSTFNKYKYIFLLENNLKRSNKIICFDFNTKNELIERFNIEERKINLLKWFFIQDKKLQNKDINIDIKTKNNIENNYLIYSAGDWIEKNIEKIIHILDKLSKKIDIVILWDAISKNVFLRNKIISLKLQNRIKFINTFSETEKNLIYQQSIWLIMPSLYETFPFHLEDALNYKIPIISSNLKSIENIFWNKISYFSPISKSDIIKNLNIFLRKRKQIINYEDIFENYSQHNTSSDFLKIIN